MRFRFLVCATAFCAVAYSQSFNLDRGGKELRVFGGSNNDELNPLHTGLTFFQSSPVENPYTVGAEAAFGLNRFLAVTGDYAYNRLGTLSGICLFGGNCGPTIASRHIHEYMGGVRFTLPTGRFSPYGVFSLGGVDSSSTSSSNGNVTGSTSSTHFAIAAGGGVDVALARHLGVAFDVRAVIPVNPSTNLGTDLRAPQTPHWLSRYAMGLYFRF